MDTGRQRRLAGTALSGAAGALYLALGGSGAYALPEGGVVAGGDIAIKRLDERQLRVEQRSNRGIVNWQSFDLNHGEHAHFQQPSASSVTLNRVAGSEQRASQIMGRLTATGKVAIVNPNGIVFGRDAVVDVAGLVASTADIKDHDFLRGGGAFSKPGRKDASIVNEGSIKVREAGMAALVAPAVRNHGAIQARLGKVTLAAGETHTLSFDSGEVLSVAVDDPTLSTLVDNQGLIMASGGQVLLTAAAAENVLGGLVESRGAVDVSSASGKGGTVTMTAPRVNVSGRVSADGHSGGQVFVGGDYLGGKGEKRYSKNPITTAKRVHIADSALITANAATSGKGGTAIVWSNEYTYFGGRIEARGGYLAGDGGFIETSSHDVLTALGTADASAPMGQAGTWLLDPNNITIQAAGSDTNINTAGSPWLSIDDSAIVTTGSIQAALNAGTSVTIQTSTAGTNAQAGDITVASPISKTAGGDASLTLKAHNRIGINSGANITSTSNKLHIVLNSDSDGNGAGPIAIQGATLDSNGGNVTLGGGSDPSLFAAQGISTRAQGVLLNNSATITAGNGNISIRGDGLNDAATNSHYGIDLRAGSKLLTTGGNITLYGSAGVSSSDGRGIILGDSGTEISSINGSIQLTGQGAGTTGYYNHGINLNNLAIVRSTGSGNVTLSGTGGYSNGVGGSHAIETWAPPPTETVQIYATSGALTLTGIRDGSYSGNLDVKSQAVNTSYGSASTTGSIRLNADTVDLSRASFLTTGTLTFAPRTASATIGINGGAGTVQFTNSGFLDRISTTTLPSKVILGDPTSGTGAVTIGSTWNVSGYNFPIEVAGGSVTGGAITMGGRDLTLIGRNGGDITLSSPITKSSGGDATLTLRADNNVLVNAGIGSTSNRLHVNLFSDSDGSNAGAVFVQGTNILTNGGDFAASGGLDPLNTTHAWGTAATQTGVNLDTATISTATGSILLRGRGQDNASVASNRGIRLSGVALSTTSGGIMLNGTGGLSSSDGAGVILRSNSQITTLSGAISLTGQGSLATAGNGNLGLNFDNGTQIASTTGTISLNGTGGGSGGASDYNYGIYLYGNGTLDNTAVVTASGAISLNGVGGNGRSFNHGVVWYRLDNGSYGGAANILSTGTGTITLNGTGGSGTDWNTGVYLSDSSSEISSVDGAIVINGTGGNGTGHENAGIHIRSGAGVISSGAATMTLNGIGRGAGSYNRGIVLDNYGYLSSVNGAISMTGQASSTATGIDNRGIDINQGGISQAWERHR